jgi:hypothetical protein
MKNDPIVRYLRARRRELNLGPLRKRRILREIEAHLLDAVEDALTKGGRRLESERVAVERLGPPELVAEQFTRKRRYWPAAAFASLAVAAAAAVVAPQIGGVHAHLGWRSVQLFTFNSVAVPGTTLVSAKDQQGRLVARLACHDPRHEFGRGVMTWGPTSVDLKGIGSLGWGAAHEIAWSPGKGLLAFHCPEP